MAPSLVIESITQLPRASLDFSAYPQLSTTCVEVSATKVITTSAKIITVMRRADIFFEFIKSVIFELI